MTFVAFVLGLIIGLAVGIVIVAAYVIVVGDEELGQ